MTADTHSETDATALATASTSPFLSRHGASGPTPAMIRFFASYWRGIASYDGASNWIREAHADLLRQDSELDASRLTYDRLQRLMEKLTRSLLTAYEDQTTIPDENTTVLSDDGPSDSDAVAIEDRLRLLIYEARDQQFEDGMDSEFSLGMRSTVASYGTTAVAVIEKHWRTIARIYPREFSEILVQLGRMDHEPTRDARRHLIESALQHPDAGLRDAAALGLDALGDPASEPALLRAIEGESVPAIEEMLSAMIRDLSIRR